MAEPMTPERVHRMGRRWRIAALLLLAVDILLWRVGVPEWLLVVTTVGVWWCLDERAECRGWLTGYRAARRHDGGRPESGDPR